LITGSNCPTISSFLFFVVPNGILEGNGATFALLLV
jgi:hypothetical protein